MSVRHLIVATPGGEILEHIVVEPEADYGPFVQALAAVHRTDVIAFEEKRGDEPTKIVDVGERRVLARAVYKGDDPRRPVVDASPDLREVSVHGESRRE